jgi:hypothetical protein
MLLLMHALCHPCTSSGTLVLFSNAVGVREEVGLPHCYCQFAGTAGRQSSGCAGVDACYKTNVVRNPAIVQLRDDGLAPVSK